MATLYYQNISLLVDHVRPWVRLENRRVSIIVQPAMYDIPMLLGHIFPSHRIVIPLSAEQALHYLESIPQTLSLPTETLLVIDEYSSPVALKLRQALFSLESAASFTNLPLVKSLPNNLSVFLILTRSLLETQASSQSSYSSLSTGPQISVLRQHHLHSIKAATAATQVSREVRDRLPILIELGPLGKKVITSLLTTLFNEWKTLQPTQVSALLEPPQKKSASSALPPLTLNQFVSITNPVSLSSAFHNAIFYLTGRFTQSALPLLSSDTDSLYQLVRSLLAATLLNPRADTASSKALADKYIRYQLLSNVSRYDPPRSYTSLLRTTKRLPTKRDLTRIYNEAVTSGILPVTVAGWVYDYAYNAYSTAEQLGHLFECISAAHSITKGYAHPELFTEHCWWIVYELSALRFTRSTLLPQWMIRLSGFIQPYDKPTRLHHAHLRSYEEYQHIVNNVTSASDTSIDLYSESGSVRASIEAGACSDSEISSKICE